MIGSLAFLRWVFRRKTDWLHSGMAFSGLALSRALVCVLAWVLGSWVERGFLQDDTQAFLVLSLIAVGTGTAAVLLAQSASWLLQGVAGGLVHRLQRRWCARILEPESRLGVEKAGSARSDSRPGVQPSLSPEVASCATFQLQAPFHAIVSFLETLYWVGFFASFHWKAALVALGSTALAMMSAYYRYRVLRLLQERPRTSIQRILQRIEAARGWLREQRRGSEMLTVLEQVQRSRLAEEQRGQWVRLRLDGVRGVSAFISGVAFTAWIREAVLGNTLRVGEAVALGLGFFLLQKAAAQLGALFAESKAQNEHAVAVIADLLPGDQTEMGVGSRPLVPEPTLRLKELHLWSQSIQVDRVPLSALGRFTFEVKRGSRTMLLVGEGVGGPGAHAEFVQSLIDLLSGRIPPSAGKLTVGDRELREMPHAWIRRWALTLNHEVLLFEGTLSDLLFLDHARSAGISQQEVDAILQATGLMGRDLTSVVAVGEMGPELRQRIQVARALLLRPELLMIQSLGEGLDPEVRSGLFAAVRKFGRTVLVLEPLDELLPLVDSVLDLHPLPAEPVPGFEVGKAERIESYLLTAGPSRWVSATRMVSLMAENLGRVSEGLAFAARTSASSWGFEVQLWTGEEPSRSAISFLIARLRAEAAPGDIFFESGSDRMRGLVFGRSREDVALYRRIAGILREAGLSDVSFSVTPWTPRSAETPGGTSRSTALLSALRSEERKSA